MSATGFQAEVGPLITGGDIEHAVIDTLREWLPAYLSDAERKHGWEVGSTPTPRGWVRTGRNLQKLTSDQLPCMVIMAGGILQAPRKEGGLGVLTGAWGISVATIFHASWGAESRDHAQLYARCVQACLNQRPLEGLAASVDFRGEVYDELDIADSRSYSASVCAFSVEVREFAWADGGPPPRASAPGDPTAPWEDWVEVTQTEVTVQNTPPPQPLPPQ